jgi:hypothetical protein
MGEKPPASVVRPLIAPISKPLAFKTVWLGLVNGPRSLDHPWQGRIHTCLFGVQIMTHCGQSA